MGRQAGPRPPPISEGRLEHTSGRNIAREKENGGACPRAPGRQQGGARRQPPPWIAVGGSAPRFILGGWGANRGPRPASKEPCMCATAVTPPRDASAFFTAGVAEVDPEIAAAIKGELGRQREEIELIASENIVSHA